ncbi:protein neuralized [Fagus crenata]
MAIAGLHNVSVLDSPFLRDSHSQASGRQADEARVRTRASSLLQMRRELEDEHVVSRDQQERIVQQRSDGLTSDLSRGQISDSDEHRGGWEAVSVSESACGTWSQTQIGSQNEHVDSSNYDCEHSSDFGEVERGRVRQIFREWMSSGGREQASNVSHMNSNPRAEWLGETEQERVRVIREWVQMNSQQRGAFDDNREEQTADIGTQIEQIRDGLLVNQNGGQNEHIRRGIRRLCGRQALLDMLKKSERERKSELQDLLEHRAVSQFPHRNRIQSLLRGRFLRNDRLIDNERPTSLAESELGLLRQRHTVSGLREGFRSRLDTPVCGQVSSNDSDTSSNSGINGIRNDQTRANNAENVVDELSEQFDPNNEESSSHRLLDVRNDLEDDVIEDIEWHRSSAHEEEWQEQLSESDVFIERRDGMGQSLNGNSQDIAASEWSETLLNESGERYYMQEAGEEISGQSEPIIEESSIHGLSDHAYNLDINWQEAAAQVVQWPEQVMETEYRDSQQDNMEYSEWRDGIREDTVENQLGSTSTHQELGNEDMEQAHLQEAPEVWHDDNGFQEAVQHWLEGPTDQGSGPVGGVDTYYFPDDDNVYSVEIRELLNRRRVSNLLRSGFRESLDHLIQSYLERRENNAPVDWELPGTSPTRVSEEQDLEQQSGDQNESQRDAAESPSHALPSSPTPPSQPLYYPESQHDNWPQHDMHQRLGIEWEIINDLRIDMARLQQRMSNMQRMLEACMDMQLELQRSIRQEVSAALNRPSDILGGCRDGLLKDESKWDYVRKGICCICCESNIDSLLYRCGHMCTCSKCANELVQSRGKCPMCWAPVVEMIRAYSIL